MEMHKAGILLLQDNAPAHTSQAAAAADCGFEILPHSPKLPDSAPSEFYLFPSLKSDLQGGHFDNDDDVIWAVEAFFGRQDEPFFRNDIIKLKHRWSKCIKLKGDC